MRFFNRTVTLLRSRSGLKYWLSSWWSGRMDVAVLVNGRLVSFANVDVADVREIASW